MDKISEIRSYQQRINDLIASNDRIISQHGTGVRPSWVSADLGYNNALIAQYKQAIKKLEWTNELD